MGLLVVVGSMRSRALVSSCLCSQFTPSDEKSSQAEILPAASHIIWSAHHRRS